MMDKDQWKAINERLENLQSSIDQTNKDLQADRKDFQDFSIRLGAVENQMLEVWKIVNNLPNRTQNAVSDAVKPIEKEARQLKEIIKDKKFIALNLINKGKKWWQFWKGKNGKS